MSHYPDTMGRNDAVVLPNHWANINRASQPHIEVAQGEKSCIIHREKKQRKNCGFRQKLNSCAQFHEDKPLTDINKNQVATVNERHPKDKITTREQRRSHFFPEFAKLITILDLGSWMSNRHLLGHLVILPHETLKKT